MNERSHRISAGALVEHEGRVLMVRHRCEGRYDFWVAPGGGVQGVETLQAAAAREVREETGLIVTIRALRYIEEFYSPEQRHCKFWFDAVWVSGELNVSAPEATSEHIVEASWVSRSELLAKQHFPSVLSGRYWQDCAQPKPGATHLGLREMAFW